MSKAVKIGAGVLIAVIAAIAIVASLLLKNLDGIIKQVIESAGSQAVGTAVTLQQVQLSLQDGRGELHGLRIANPAGYSTPNAFSMDQVALEIDPTSLTGPVIVIREVLVDGALLQAEQKMASTNLTELLNGMQGSGQPAEQPAPTAGESTADVRLMIEKLSVINNSASLLTSQWGEKSLDIPDIRINNIGDKETGLTPQQLANRITGILVKRVEKAASKHLEKIAKEAAQKELEKQLDKNLDEDDKKKLNALKDMFSK